jgi:diguanylate cyclase (GGDEF)-like protein
MTNTSALNHDRCSSPPFQFTQVVRESVMMDHQRNAPHGIGLERPLPMPHVTLDQVLACPNLPSLPAVALDVLKLTNTANINLNEIAQLVQNDQALCAKILKTVNSSFYGLSKPCPTITRAFTYLGLSTVKSLVLGFSLVDCTRGEHGFDLIDYWRRCIYSAAAARRVATISGACDPEETFIAALMQDLGMPAIHSALGTEYTHLIAQTDGDHDRLPQIEFDLLQFHHGEAGARLGERWRLPEQMIHAIRYHHNPEAAANHIELVRAVALGYYAASTLTLQEAGRALNRFCHFAEMWFGFSGPQSTMLLSTISDDARELSRLFKINTGQPPDINAILAQAEEASLQHQFMVQREAEELRQSNTDLARLAVTDALTGAGNRKQFDEELASRFEQARSFKGCLALAMFDADRFKSLNDTYGHQVGDAVLAEIARRLKQAVGTSGVVCRYGGEEFAAILPGADRRAAAALADAARQAVAESAIDLRHLQGAVDSVPVTVSAGVAVYEPTVAQRLVSQQLLIHAADKALYAAKAGGRNCVRVFSPKSPVPT